MAANWYRDRPRQEDNCLPLYDQCGDWQHCTTRLGIVYSKHVATYKQEVPNCKTARRIYTMTDHTAREKYDCLHKLYDKHLLDLSN
jgi:hypothetical protein